MDAIRSKRWIALVLALLVAAGTCLTNAATVSASGSSSVDVLDPDFINDHNGTSVNIQADPNRSPYDVFGEAFGTDNPVEGATKTARQSPTWGEAVAKHVENFYDEALGKEVFKVEVGGNDCFTCYLHNTTYDSETDTFTGGNDDRQRIEIRPGGENSDLIGLENDITAYNWKLKLDQDLPKPDGFFHIFQYKAVNASGDISGFDTDQLHDAVNYPTFNSDEDGNPILTLTVSSSATQKLEFRYAGIGSEAGQEVLAGIPVDDIRDRWVEVTVKILNSESGWVAMSLKDVETGELLMEYNEPDRILDMWRRPEIKYSGKTFEGPYPAVDDMLNRPKWGIYRKADKSNDNVKDAKIYLADMTLYKSAVGVKPVNLAYGKAAYNSGDTSGNAFQLAHAKAERLTDGVQTDPLSYENIPLTSVPSDDHYSAMGKLAWIGTQSSKKGNVIIDLGQAMSFSQIKLFAKSHRLKYVNFWISDDTADHTEADIDTISFDPVDPLHTDDKGDWAFYHAENSGGNDYADKEYLIDLGKTYSSRYVKLYFENGSGSNKDNGDGTFSMTGPPRITELEIYNAPLTPKNVTIDYTSGSEATISWDDTSADYFIIYDAGTPLVDNADSHVYQLTNLDPGALYNLSVRTVYTDPYSYKSMLSAESEVVPLQTDGDPIIPDPPVSVTAEAATDQSIDVSWAAVADAQSYRISLATDAVERIVADEFVGTSFTIKDLSPGTPYTVKVYSIRRGAPSTAAAEAQVTTTGIRNGSDNLLFNKEVQYTRVWNDDTSSYGGHQALDNDIDGSRWVALKGSETAWLMVDIGEVTQVNTLEYYSFQNKLKKVSFYYATDGEAFTDPNSDKWTLLLTEDRVAQGKFGDPNISSTAESIALDTPVDARFIKFTVDEVDGDINVNEIRAFGPMSFTDDSALTAVETTATSVDMSWAGSATTLPATSYEVYNGSNKLTTVTADVYNYTATGLTPNTEYTFRVMALSQTVTEDVYSTFGGLTLQVTTLPGSSTPTDPDPDPQDPEPSDPDPSDPEPSSDDPTGSEDKPVDTTVTQETTPDGRNVTKVKVDGNSLKTAAVGNTIVDLMVDSDGQDVVVELPLSALQEADSLQAINIQANEIAYELPLSLLRPLARDAVVSVHIGAVYGQRLDEVTLALTRSGSEQLLDSPIEFKLLVSGEERTDFNGIYVKRTVKLKQSADPDQLTAVWIDDENKLHFVPATVTMVDGIAEVSMWSPHNSIYTVISNSRSFDDIQDHWAQNDIELLANKRIVNGQSEANYHPEGSITRAEFTALLVRSLGLTEEKTSSFTDVPTNAWSAGAIGAAERFGLVQGFEDGTFRPESVITREEMAVMTVRALRAGGQEPSMPTQTSLTFTDHEEIAKWSKQAISQLVSIDVMRGSNGSFAPQDEATRAESAAIIKRMLKHLSFIN